MRVRVLFFGVLKDLVGRAHDERHVEPGANLRSVFEAYAAQYPRLRDLAPNIVIARNQEFAEPSAVLEDGDEVAFLPPVSGGSSADSLQTSVHGNYFALTWNP